MKQTYTSVTKIQLGPEGAPLKIVMTTPDFPEMEPEENAPSMFTGNALISVTDPNGKVVGQQPFSFPIEASNIQEAFAKFIDAGEKAMVAFQQEARDNAPRILTPGQGG